MKGDLPVWRQHPLRTMLNAVYQKIFKKVFPLCLDFCIEGQRGINEHGSIFETEIDDIKDRQEELRTILSSILRRLDQIQH